MNKTKIEWADYTWNPVTGCKHGCQYCYAQRIHNRFNKNIKWEDPVFHLDRLRDPFKEKKPSKIFVCSMADLFGDWISHAKISEVLAVATFNPRHKFMFLTKNPKRYQKFYFPENCWLGTTITGKHELFRYDHLREKAGKNILFISIEPILTSFKCVRFKDIDMIILGAMTGPGAIKPKPEWIESVHHQNIFYKDNIKKYL